ncbi:carbohydrate ABC transporter permease [Brachybacterium alimentarium]|uniref:carbohydrate ABC transporter permease n=1 Tax=Brachybacterium alimentarium TaxID=47845 RepID=UPI0023B8A7D2|nr:ABC transporter permease subunit [Brachybacterium alimentarium]
MQHRTQPHGAHGADRPDGADGSHQPNGAAGENGANGANGPSGPVRSGGADVSTAPPAQANVGRSPAASHRPAPRRRRGSGSMQMRALAGYAGTYVVLAVAAVLTLGPFLFSVLTAFTRSQQFAQEGPLSIPSPPALENFVSLFTSADGFVTPVAVTVQVVAVILVGQMVFSVLAAYAFAQLRFPGRDLLFWVYVATLMVPQVVVVVPLYLMMSEVGLRNTFWALILPFVLGSPYAIFLLRENFRGVPTELMDAMRIDGAGTLRLLWHLVVPLNRPIIVTLVLITVVTHWNNFMWPMVITSGPEWRVITVATSALQSQYNNNWTLVMAGTTLAMLPLVILMIVFQKQITNSVGDTTMR